MVFNTSMTGYQEVLTDPSYAGQIVCMTYPLIGNYGINAEDAESTRPWVEGFVVREASRIASNWRSEESLESYLKRWNIVAIDCYDSRDQLYQFQEGHYLPAANILAGGTVPELIYHFNSGRYFITAAANEDKPNDFTVSFDDSYFDAASVQKRTTK